MTAAWPGELSCDQLEHDQVDVLISAHLGDAVAD